MTTGRLPEAEQDVLATLYELGEAQAREIRERLHGRRPLAHASVVTLLSRLEARRLVTRRKADAGKAFVYRPTREKERVFAPMVTGLVRRAFEGSRASLVASLFESRPPSSEEIKALETLLEEWKEPRKRGGTP